MHKRKTSVKGFFLLLALSLTFHQSSLYATTIDRQKREKQELIERKKKEESKRNKLTRQREVIEYQIEKLDQEAVKISERIESIGSKIDTNRKKLKRIEREITEADKISKKHYDTMKRRIKYMYENGDVGYLDMLLGSKDLEDLLNQADYMSEISEYDNNLLDRYHSAIAYSMGKKAEREEKIEELKEDEAEAREEKSKNREVAKLKQEKFDEYNSLIKQSDTKISRVSGQIAEKEAYIDRLIAEEEKRRREEARRLAEERRKAEALRRARERESAKDQTTGHQPAVTNTGFLWPVPTHRSISSGYGPRGIIIKGSGTFHYGIDIPAPTGTGIVAAAGGTVIGASYNYSMGNYVLLDHGNGYYTVYMHGSKLLVSAGQTVTRGQLIAKVGSTGNSTGPHLHFGIKVNGIYVNPRNYVSP